MKCDDFLALRTTGNAWQRLRACWHARRCDRCAAAAHAIAQFERDLAHTQPLPPHLRAVWERAAAQESPRPVFAWGRLRIATVALAAALLLIAVGALFWRSLGRPVDAPHLVVKDDDSVKPISVPLIRERTIDASQALAQLLDEVDTLQSQLAALSQQADLLEARRQADTMIATYSHWR